jgi:hypothetical protein
MEPSCPLFPPSHTPPSREGREIKQKRISPLLRLGHGLAEEVGIGRLDRLVVPLDHARILEAMAGVKGECALISHLDVQADILDCRVLIAYIEDVLEEDRSCGDVSGEGELRRSPKCPNPNHIRGPTKAETTVGSKDPKGHEVEVDLSLLIHRPGAPDGPYADVV